MANIITISRIIIAFIALSMLFWGPSYALPALLLTIIVMWFDGLDGYVARKFNESSKLGAVLDIMGDRIVENIYWMCFCALGFISVVVPIIFITRGIITDSLRSLALAKGFTPFGEKTMMQGKIEKFIVASNFMRFSYAIVKAAAFILLIAGNLPYYENEGYVYVAGLICTVLATILCVLRGLPVIFESSRFIEEAK